MRLMHPRVARLIDDVTSAVKFGKTFAHGRVKHRLGNAVGQRTDYEPAHLEITLSGSEHRARSPKIFVGARCQRSESGVLPNLEQSAKVALADFGRGAAVNNNNGLALKIISSNDTAHGILKF